MASSHSSTLSPLPPSRRPCSFPRWGSMTASKVEHAHELEEGTAKGCSKQHYPFGMQDIADI